MWQQPPVTGRPGTDVAQGWVANAPSPSEAAGSTTLRPRSVMLQTVPQPLLSKNTGDPLLLIGSRGGRRRRDDRSVSFNLDDFQ